MERFETGVPFRDGSRGSTALSNGVARALHWPEGMSRILEVGPGAVSDVELVVALLKGSGRREHLEELAARVLDGGLLRLRRMPPSEVLREGIRGPQAARLLAGVELGRRAMAAEQRQRERFLAPDLIAARLWPLLADLAHEEFWAFLMTARMEEVRCVRVASGGLTQCSVLPREAFAPALVHAAPCVAFAHNHPSGDPTPSADDHRLELMLDEAGRALGVRVVDHLVIAADGFHSARTGAGAPPRAKAVA
jgi:DNA repair protein RadC